MDPKDLLNKLKKNGYGPFVEVPCSSLAPLISAAQEDPEVDVINPTNEAIAIGIASGAYLAGKKPVLLIQNSGFLNVLNSLTSLNQIYDIPVLLIISWRGYSKDAPEHEIVGRDLEKYLATFDVPYRILENGNENNSISDADEYIKTKKKPFALLVKPGLFDKKKSADFISGYSMERKDAIKTVKETLTGKDYKIVSTNGFISRESFDIKETDDFYMMGSMGHALPIGLGLARYSDKKIAVFDGDGSILMHMGAMPNVKTLIPKNLLHIVFDNEVYASTEDQPTLAKEFDLSKMAQISGYKKVCKASDKKSLEKALDELVRSEGPGFLLIKVRPGNSKNCKRVSDQMTCTKIKEKFMVKLNEK